MKKLDINGKEYNYFPLTDISGDNLSKINRLPHTLKVLLENIIRNGQNSPTLQADIDAIINSPFEHKKHEISYRPARVLMQDFTGVPAIVDLAAMRDAISKLNGNPEKINPLVPVDLVIDHSVQVDAFGNETAIARNIEMEMHRNNERYKFLRWGQKAFDDFRVVPPGTGICHQVNLEYFGKTVWRNNNTLYPDTLVGTDSHTTMINALGILGWGVGGIEAEAAMLGQPISMLIPEVVGVKLTGKLREGVNATDLVLTITEILRQTGVVSKFVEYFGEGLDNLPLADRATISNMSPEYGATCGFFPVDDETLKYLKLTGRDDEQINLVKEYSKAQGMWRLDNPEPVFNQVVELDMSTVEPSLAGPKRPQDRVTLAGLTDRFNSLLEGKPEKVATVAEEGFELKHGDVVIAAITSCTNTSNPSILMAAGILAKKAALRGLKTKPWVKTSLAPGSKVVTDYLEAADLQKHLNELGFNLVGYGCTTCIGNSGPLSEPITKAIKDNDLVVSAVLSGNRNFEGRIHPLTQGNWLASPPLVVAYALAGTTRINLESDPIGYDTSNTPVFLRDLWPSSNEIAEAVLSVKSDMFKTEYSEVFEGDASWQEIPVSGGKTYGWQDDSTYIKNPPFFENMTKDVPDIQPIKNARILALLGDSVTTDHISPAGAIKFDSPAGKYLQENGVEQKDFNSYGSRRGNHEVMMRGTFANIRLQNEMTPDKKGGYTRHWPEGNETSIFEAAMQYKADKVPLVVIAGKEYGTGSSRDWAAKGTTLLGVKAVIAESYERIHRSNLIGMGVLPLEFTNGVNRKTLELKGDETVTILGMDDSMQPGMKLKAKVEKSDGNSQEIELLSRIDTENELHYYRNEGILQYVLRQSLN